MAPENNHPTRHPDLSSTTTPPATRQQPIDSFQSDDFNTKMAYQIRKVIYGVALLTATCGLFAALDANRSPSRTTALAADAAVAQAAQRWEYAQLIFFSSWRTVIADKTTDESSGEIKLLLPDKEYVGKSYVEVLGLIRKKIGRDDSVCALNALADDGWELVTHTSSENHAVGDLVTGSSLNGTLNVGTIEDWRVRYHTCYMLRRRK